MEELMAILNRVSVEHEEKRLYVRTVKSMNGEDHKMTGHGVSSEKYLTGRGYGEHYERTIRTFTETLKPRTFGSEREIRAYMKHTERLAGRTLEDAEWGILLRTITNGRQYELVCVEDLTRELEGIPRYER